MPSSLFPFPSSYGFLALLLALVLYGIIAFRRSLQAVRHMPGYRPPFYPFSLAGVILPTWGWHLGMDMHWVLRRKLYRTGETFSMVPFFPGSATSIWSSNLDVARQVVVGGHKTSFIKPEVMSRALLIWGMNLIAADREVWRKHRRVLGPAFNQDLYKLVWEQSIQTYNDMISCEGWKERVEVPVMQRLTFKFALLIIGTCGFGFSFDWAEPLRVTNEEMSIQECLRIAADTHLMHIMLPSWTEYLPIRRVRTSAAAFRTLTHFMKEQVQTRKAETNNLTGSRASDAFSRLVEANEAESEKLRLDDDELIGNVYGLLLAGHETTAHSLAATLGLLAVHEEFQESVYEEIVSVIGHDRTPTVDESTKFPLVLGSFFEAIRMFPAGHIMFREATEDTVIQIPNPPSEEGTTSVPIQKGMQVVIDMIGVQYNPRYFQDPFEYKPSRWLDIPADSEAFSAFSVGARACLGRKFAITEAIAFLSVLIRDWKIRPLLKSGETESQWRDRVIDGSMVLTLGVKDVPLVFTSRH